MTKQSYIIGIDEVGRGPLAGPVTVCAVLKPKKMRLPSICKSKKLKKIPLKDSKKLRVKQREVWFKFIKQQNIPYAIANVGPKIIDKINISQAANLAAARALAKLIIKLQKSFNLSIFQYFNIFLDGGLKINPPLSKKLMANGYSLKTVVRGDEKIPDIALASIIAKIHRDKYMRKLHKKYPQYEFDIHKGYGTKKHYKKIKKHGVSEIHRKSFLKKIRKPRSEISTFFSKNRSVVSQNSTIGKIKRCQFQTEKK
ncbi:MAG: ribonuclease HII [Patescibacteria group bacterium]|nr:ribonuclease HII [Patescibacteria group bacterium]